MAEPVSSSQQRVVQEDRRVTSEAPTTTQPVARSSGRVIIARLVWFAAAVVAVLLAFRFVFVLLGANPANSFANFIYTTSHPLVAPFFGLFSYHLRYGVSRFELFTLVAIAVYLLLAYGIARLLTIDRPTTTTV